MKLPKVMIVILNWNGTDDTIECILSVERIDYRNYEIVLVDNNSNMKSFREIESKFPRLKIIRNKTNLGFAEGNNIGLEHALNHDFQYVLLLNNDTIVNKNFLSILVNYIEKHQDVGICGPVMCYYDNRKCVWQTGGFYSVITGRLRMKYSGEKITSIKERVLDLDYIPGACLLIRTSIIRKIGLLDVSFFNQCEDLDWGLKTKLISKRVVCVTDSIIYHKVSNSTPTCVNNYFRFRNLLAIDQRYSKNITISFFILFISAIINIIRYLIKFKLLQVKYIIYGIRDFYKGNMGIGSLKDLLNIRE